MIKNQIGDDMEIIIILLISGFIAILTAFIEKYLLIHDGIIISKYYRTHILNNTQYNTNFVLCVRGTKMKRNYIQEFRVDEETFSNLSIGDRFNSNKSNAIRLKAYNIRGHK